MNFKKILILLVVFNLAIGAGWFGTVLRSRYVKVEKKYISHRARSLTVSVVTKDHPGEFHGGGTGVIVKPGPNGNMRILTNGHICDAVSVYPDDEEEYYKMSLRDSLLLPVKAEIIFFNDKKADVKRILKHAVMPDLCLIEINKQWGERDYARLASQRPVTDDDIFTIGYPGLHTQMRLNGSFQGIEKSPFPIRMSPKIKKKIEEKKQELSILVMELFSLIFSIVGAETPGEAEFIQEDIRDYEKRIKELKKELQQLMWTKPVSWYVLNAHSYGGSSGSGVWNDRGELVALIWGRRMPGNIALAVTLDQIKSFYEPRLTW